MNTVFLDVGEELHQFHRTVYDIDMPQIDVDALLSRLFDCFVHFRSLQYDMMNLIQDLVNQGEIFEHVDNSLVDNGQEDRILKDLVKLATGVSSKIFVLGLYDNGIFNYRYKETLNDNTVILVKIQSEGVLPRKHDRAY
jgi:hypothetical protein